LGEILYKNKGYYYVFGPREIFTGYAIYINPSNLIYINPSNL
jgi:hypothetical protein